MKAEEQEEEIALFDFSQKISKNSDRGEVKNRFIVKGIIQF